MQLNIYNLYQIKLYFCPIIYTVRKHMLQSLQSKHESSDKHTLSSEVASCFFSQSISQACANMSQRKTCSFSKRTAGARSTSGVARKWWDVDCGQVHPPQPWSTPPPIMHHPACRASTEGTITIRIQSQTVEPIHVLDQCLHRMSHQTWHIINNTDTYCKTNCGCTMCANSWCLFVYFIFKHNLFYFWNKTLFFKTNSEQLYNLEITYNSIS